MCFGRDSDLLREPATKDYVARGCQPTLRHAEFCVTSGPVFRGKLASLKMEGRELFRVSPEMQDPSAAP